MNARSSNIYLTRVYALALDLLAKIRLTLHPYPAIPEMTVNHCMSEQNKIIPLVVTLLVTGSAGLIRY